MALLEQNVHETFGAAPDLCGQISTVSAARTLVDLLWRSFYVGLQLAVTTRISTAARSKAWVMLRRSWQAGLQLEVAKCIATAARREELGCRSYRRAIWEAGHSRSSLDKWLLREEVAERRGASAKRSLSEDALKDKQLTHPSVHPSIYPSCIHPPILQFIHWFVHSFIHWFIDSLIHLFIGSLIHLISD